MQAAMRVGSPKTTVPRTRPLGCPAHHSVFWSAGPLPRPPRNWIVVPSMVGVVAWCASGRGAP
jgi:hypothetical protein